MTTDRAQPASSGLFHIAFYYFAALDDPDAVAAHLGFLASITGNSDDYRDTYAQKIVRQPGSFLITIDAERQPVDTQTAEMLHRIGGTNINERTPGR